MKLQNVPEPDRYTDHVLADDWDPNSPEPPSDIDRIILFRHLAYQFETATQSLRFADPDPKQQTDELAHSRFVRASLLRKFFMGKDNQVHLNKVVESLQQIAQSSSQLQATYGCDAGSMVAQQFYNIRSDKEQISLGGGPGEGTYSKSKVFESIVYGNVLHADYGKWRLTRVEPAFIFTVAHVVSKMEKVLFEALCLVREFVADYQKLQESRNTEWD